MKKVIQRMPHAAKGIAFGDVSNSAVRNILSEISAKLYGKVNIKSLEETEEFFGWCCPYTGKYLKDEIEKGSGKAQCDHIVSQNQDHAGLNVIGNLVYVDRDANRDKKDRGFEEFILSDAIEGTLQEKQARIDKIKEWQKRCHYAPDGFEAVLSDRLREIYDEVRKTQERYIAEVLQMVDNTLGLQPVAPTVKSKREKTSAASAQGGVAKVQGTTNPKAVTSGSGVGQYIRGELTRLLEGGLLTPPMLHNLQDRAYCRETFGISFPVVVEITDTFDPARYYKGEPVCGRYRICSQWYDKHLEKYNKWLTDIAVTTIPRVKTPEETEAAIKAAVKLW